jgi:hypothetical protein
MRNCRHFYWQSSLILEEVLHFLLHLYLYDCIALVDLGIFFSFLILYSVGRTPWTGDQSVARPLPTHRTTQTQSKCTQISMPLMGIRTNDPSVWEAKAVHALDSAATVIGLLIAYKVENDAGCNIPSDTSVNWAYLCSISPTVYSVKERVKIGFYFRPIWLKIDVSRYFSK